MRIPFLDKGNPLPPLTDAECEAILEPTNNSLRLALLVGLNSGISQNELLALGRANVDMTAQCLIIPSGGSGRRVVLPQRIMKLIGEYMLAHEGPALFPIPQGTFTSKLKEIGAGAGITLNWQRIRSTYARNAARANVSILTCASNMGTAPVNIKHYFVLDPDAERSSVNKIWFKGMRL
jgi:integrase